MPKINLTKRELAVLYQCVINEMERVKRSTPPEYADDIQSLELKVSKLFKL
jgi:hypothetical protein